MLRLVVEWLNEKELRRKREKLKNTKGNGLGNISCAVVENDKTKIVRGEKIGIRVSAVTESNSGAKLMNTRVLSGKLCFENLSVVPGESILVVGSESHMKQKQLFLDEQGVFEGWISISLSCNKQHYSKAHTPNCLQKITQPLYFLFETQNLDINEPSILSVYAGPIIVTEKNQKVEGNEQSEDQKEVERKEEEEEEIDKGKGEKRIFEFGNEKIIALEGHVMAGYGHIVWDAALVLCKYLWQQEKGKDRVKTMEKVSINGKRCIELGSGVGLVGIAASLLGAKVILSDMESALPLTRANVQLNQTTIKQRGGFFHISPLEWGNEENHSALQQLPKPFGAPPYDVILASDVVYDNDLFEPLIKSIVFLSDEKTQILLAARQRHGCDFDLFISSLEKYFEVMVTTLEGEVAVFAQSSVLSKAKMIPHIYRLKKKKKKGST